MITIIFGVINNFELSLYLIKKIPLSWKIYSIFQNFTKAKDTFRFLIWYFYIWLEMIHSKNWLKNLGNIENYAWKLGTSIVIYFTKENFRENAEKLHYLLIASISNRCFTKVAWVLLYDICLQVMKFCGPCLKYKIYKYNENK